MPASVVIGTQWGDEGKGKVVDLLAADADVVVRFHGGNNAGHTLVVDGEKTVLNLIPAGVLHPGRICMLGPGMVIDPEVLVAEIDALRARSAASSASPRPTRRASARGRFRPSSPTRSASACAPTARSTAPPPGGRAAAAGSTPWSSATRWRSPASTGSRSPSSTC